MPSEFERIIEGAWSDREIAALRSSAEWWEQEAVDVGVPMIEDELLAAIDEAREGYRTIMAKLARPYDWEEDE